MKYLILFLILSVSLWGQQVNKQEAQFETLQKQILHTEQQFQKAQQQLNNYLSGTDSLKKARAGADVLTRRTAQAYEFAKTVESINSRLRRLKNQGRTLRSRLYRTYSVQIDSLNKELSTHPNDKTRKQLFSAMTKRLSVSPVAESLHFNPAYIGQIDSTVLKEPLGRELAQSYLAQADSSLSREIDQLQKKEREMQQIISLRAKAADFVEEMDDTRMTSFEPIATKATTTDANAYSDDAERIGTAKDLANYQSETYFLLMHALEPGASINEDSSQMLEYPELLQRLSQTRRFLQQYQKQIQRKLQSIRKP